MSANPVVEQIVEGLLREGYLVDLNVSRWSGQARLTEEDLGLEGLTDADLHRLGHKQLVAKDELAKIAAIESRARKILADRSYPFPLGQARFVPVKCLGRLLSEFDRLRGEFTEAVAAFVDKYQGLTERAKAEWMKNARELKSALGKDDAWLTAFEGRLNAAYPDREEIREAFEVSWNLYQFQLPAGLSMKVVDATRAMAAARLAEEARRKVESEIQAFVGEAAMELRRRAAQLCEHVSSMVVKAGDRLSEKTLNPLRELIGEFQNMDFTGDQEFAEILDRLRSSYLSGDAAARMREDQDFRKAFGQALDAVTQKVTAEADKAANEVIDRFLKFGNTGRKVVHG